MFDLKASRENHFRNEILSGLTLALSFVPKAVAFAFVAGVPPIIGLYSAFIVGFVTSAFGGRPGMISGGTGSLAVILVVLVSKYGIDYMFAALVLMGILQILFGLLKFGRFIRLIPESVIFGFVNGLGVTIFASQFRQFKGMTGSALNTMIGFVILTMAIIHFWPRLTKAIPASLGGIAVVSAIIMGFGIDTRRVGDIASIKGTFPTFHLPQIPYTLETLKIIVPYAIILAGIGILESMLTLILVDEMTETRGHSNKECVAQGAANLLTGFFGGMGGCAMISQSVINLTSGGRGRLSGISASLFLLCFLLFGSSFIERIPVAALVGLMFMVAIGTFEWSSFRIINRIPKSDAWVIVMVSVLTVVFDLALAVGAGIIASALVFAWKSAIRIQARQSFDSEGIKHYQIFGPLFFGSASLFLEKFDPQNDPQEVVIDFRESRIMDHSGIEALQKITDRYKKIGKRVRLRHLSPDCVRLLKKAGDMIEVNHYEDPNYSVLEDD